MTQTETQTGKSPLLRKLPLIAVLVGAALGWWLLGDRLSFQTLADNRDALIAFRECELPLSRWWASSRSTR